LPAPPSLVGDFSNTAYGGYVRAIALISAGLVNDALVELTEVVAAPQAPARAATLLADLDSALSASPAVEASPSSIVRRALLSVALTGVEPDAAQAAFQAMSSATGMALADVWRGALAASLNDRLGAGEALARGSDGFDYGRAVRASFLLSRGSDEYLEDVDALLAAGPASGSAALLGVSIVAEVASDDERELASLLALSRAAPFMAYPLDRLSHIYFDEGDGRAAAEALAVAVELEPESDLYWTNLGWAYYLIGALDVSEEASARALELDGTQEVAAYNLGLVRAATGRLPEALAAYQQALRADPVVNLEAIEDLEGARVLYAGQTAVDYALAVLYEASGSRTDARRAYERFLRSAAADESMADFLSLARERAQALSAPLPPLVIEGGVQLSLGSRGPTAGPYNAGDPLYPTFELSTPGDELPGAVDVTVALRPADADDAEALVEVQSTVAIPAGAVGFVVNVVELPLPLDLAAGDYAVTVEVRGDEQRQVSGRADITVAGGPDLLRRLVGRSLVMTAFESGRPLYSSADLGGQRFIAALVQELQGTADLAEQALPTVEAGRFAGLTGGQVFRDSSEQDVQDFLAYVLASEARDSQFSFVDAYAQWALDGAPGEPTGP
ncbi:MAG TPA: tetratricopeptide repeat protein, partial [Trueperaceae bacterium]|nr:tetratricopeptide repeat protein [Trueperaceae bacterium]